MSSQRHLRKSISEMISLSLHRVLSISDATNKSLTALFFIPFEMVT